MEYPGNCLLLLTLLSLLGTSTLQEYGTRLRAPNSNVSRRRGANPTIDKRSDVASNSSIASSAVSSAHGTNQSNRLRSSTIPNNSAITKQDLTKNWLVEKEQDTAPSYTGLSDGNKKGATFFFTHVEPHRFEYRAMFQHRTPHFEPFVRHFEPFGGEFPPLPKFPEFPRFFPEHKDPFPKLPDFGEFPPFPTLVPAIKRSWLPNTESQTQRPVLDENLDGPLKSYDVVLGNVQYPKIFRFNDERINIEEFERQKKARFKTTELHQNHILEPENVKRNQLLILHGGIFTVQEPPLYNRRKKNRKLIYGNKVPFHP